MNACKYGSIFWPEGERVMNVRHQLLLKSRFKGGLIINYDGINLHLIQVVLMGNQVPLSS